MGVATDRLGIGDRIDVIYWHSMEVHERQLTRTDVEELVSLQAPAHLRDCDLRGVDLGELDLSGWIFERCNLAQTDFGNSRLECSRWQSCQGAFASFVGSDLAESTFASSDFNNALFRRSVLSDSSFRACKLTGADLTDAKTFDLKFDETLLIHTKMQKFSFRNQVLRKLDFSQADLETCDFRGTIFEDCSLRDTNLIGARFDGADLRGADLGGLKLSDATLFRGATVSREQAGALLSELGINVR